MRHPDSFSTEVGRPRSPPPPRPPFFAQTTRIRLHLHRGGFLPQGPLTYSFPVLTCWLSSILGAALGLTLTLSACGGGQDDGSSSQGSGDQGAQEQEYDNPVPAPEYEDDDSVRLPLGFISPVGQNEAAPLEDGGIGEADDAPGDPFQAQPEQSEPHLTEIARTDAFGCEDRISVIQTVPMVVDDPAGAALEFLLEDQYGQHGSPEFVNALAVTDLSIESVEHSGGTVTVELSGQPRQQAAARRGRC
ncbi:hypothetical protein [Nesterenkonia pannonica]|uniref:hypothetical protein n=1 Tax=Nesterenkonia pannonica TaxID=1548602 RepID=UPI002164880E|nr:hypothetical protein [Nesterenkonia pannonica]